MLREVISNEIFTVLFIVCLGIVALTKTLYPNRFAAFLQIFLNFKYLKIYAREKTLFNGFNMLLFSNLLLGIAIFSYIWHLKFWGAAGNLMLFLFFVFFIAAAFFLTKKLLEIGVGNLFNIQEIVHEHVFQKISYKNFFGLILLLINPLFIYQFTPTKLILYAVLLLFFLLQSISIFSIYKRYQNAIKSKILYFILYICIFEIIPYVILCKLLTDFT